MLKANFLAQWEKMYTENFYCCFGKEKEVQKYGYECFINLATVD
jgi:hypothetical protein